MQCGGALKIHGFALKHCQKYSACHYSQIPFFILKLSQELFQELNLGFILSAGMECTVKLFFCTRSLVPLTILGMRIEGLAGMVILASTTASFLNGRIVSRSRGK